MQMINKDVLHCRLLGSHGQNLSELAENMQPAMAKNPSGKWELVNGKTNQPW